LFTNIPSVVATPVDPYYTMPKPAVALPRPTQPYFATPTDGFVAPQSRSSDMRYPTSDNPFAAGEDSWNVEVFSWGEWLAGGQYSRLDILEALAAIFSTVIMCSLVHMVRNETFAHVWFKSICNGIRLVSLYHFPFSVDHANSVSRVRRLS
jgi:hypothetical protein